MNMLTWILNLFRRKKKKITEKLIEEFHDLQCKILEYGKDSYIKNLDLSVELRITSNLGNLDSTKEMQRNLKFARMSKKLLDLQLHIEGTAIYTGKTSAIRDLFDNVMPLKNYNGKLIDNDINWVLNIKQSLDKIKEEYNYGVLFHVTGIKYNYDDFNKSKFFKLIGPLNVVTVNHNYCERYNYSDIIIPHLPKFNYPSLVELVGSKISSNELWIAYNKDEYLLFKCINNEYVMFFVKKGSEKRNEEKSIIDKYV